MKINSKDLKSLTTINQTLNILFYCVIAISIILLATFIYFNFVSPSNPAYFTIEDIGIRISLDASLLPTSIMLTIFFSTVIGSIMLLYGLYHLKAIFASTIKEGHPFTLSTYKSMKYLGYTFFAYVLLSMIMQLVITIQMPHITLTDVMISTNIKPPFVSLIAGIILLGIAKIFKYGQELKQDNESIV